jgi:hypothetical protein
MGSAPHVQEGSMGNAPYVHSRSLGVLFTVVAWDGERSLSKVLGSWARYQSVEMGNGECFQCSFPLAGSALYHSSLEWGALPIQGTGQLGEVPLWRMGLWGALPMFSPSCQ